MRTIFTTKANSNITDLWLLILRVSIGAIMLTHAMPKLNLLFSGEEIMFLDPLGVGSTASLVLVVFAEFLCSIFLIVGFGTRVSTIPLIFTMFIAAFVFHKDDPFSQKELAILFMLIYIGILITGPGKFSIDRLLSKR